MLIDAARSTGNSGNVGDGTQRWRAVHRLDAARLFHGGAPRSGSDKGFDTPILPAQEHLFMIGAPLRPPPRELSGLGSRPRSACTSGGQPDGSVRLLARRRLHTRTHPRRPILVRLVALPTSARPASALRAQAWDQSRRLPPAGSGTATAAPPSRPAAPSRAARRPGFCVICDVLSWWHVGRTGYEHGHLASWRSRPAG